MPVIPDSHQGVDSGLGLESSWQEASPDSAIPAVPQWLQSQMALVPQASVLSDVVTFPVDPGPLTLMRSSSTPLFTSVAV